MRVSVGIVYHREPTSLPFRADGAVELMTHVNAGVGTDPSPWLGFGANHNRLIADAGHLDWYVALNPDVQVSAAEIHELVTRAEEEGYTIVAPMFRAPWGLTGAPQPQVPGPGQWLRETFTGSCAEAPSGGAVAPSSWVSGACMAIRMKEWRPSFDERYFMYFEDVDICLRAAEVGLRVGVCPEVVLDHGSGWSTGDPLLRRRGVEFARSAREFVRRNGGSPLAMRLAGLLRFGSRLAIPGRGATESAAARAISSGFLLGAREGLAEMARRHNEQLG